MLSETLLRPVFTMLFEVARHSWQNWAWW